MPAFELDIDGKEIRVRAGEPLDVTIPYVGAPRPEIKWTKEGQQIPGIETTADTTRLYISSSKRSDSGQCRIEATNSEGRCEARVLISVVDKPSAPEGPMTYPTTTRNSVTVAWKEPKDNGGTELTGYRLEYQATTFKNELIKHLIFRNLGHPPGRKFTSLLRFCSTLFATCRTESNTNSVFTPKTWLV